MSTGTLVVSEVFGPTVQGEGPSTGRRCAFVRLGACNLTCSWCDTPYTWDASRFDLHREMGRERVDAVADMLASFGVDMVVVSGGEPLLQQSKGLADLVRALPTHWRIEVETNGTIEPNATLASRCHFNVSPKLAHSGVALDKRIRPKALSTFVRLAHSRRASFKIVVTGPGDLDEVDALALPRHKTWIMPEGTTAEQVERGLAAVAGEAIRRGYNLTGRLHVSIWNGERGR